MRAAPCETRHAPRASRLARAIAARMGDNRLRVSYRGSPFDLIVIMRTTFDHSADSKRDKRDGKRDTLKALI